MRLICCLAVLCSLGQAQNLPQADGPAAVDVNVSDVSWHPFGPGLLYEKPDSKGKAIGVYALGSREGSIVFHLGAGDSYEAQWFSYQPLVTLISYHKSGSGDEAKVEATVYLADAATGQSSKLWSEVFAAKDGVNVDVDTSPKLRHAIYRVKTWKQVFAYVLPSGGSKLIRSRDLEQAASEGFHGPTWSVDGTAVYSKESGSDVMEVSKFLERKNSAEITLDVANMAKTLAAADESRSRLLVSKLWVSRPVPAAGAAVLELMPANASLRQVRFKGQWQFNKPPTPTLLLVSRPMPLQMGQGRGIANSLWLTSDKEKLNGLLIAPHADKSWLAPWNMAVAYLADGALIVRTLRYSD